MRAVHAMMMLIGALAVLLTGVAPVGAAADISAAPPCHEAQMESAGAESPGSTPDKALKAMHCCVASIAAPTLLPPDQARPAAPGPTVVAAPAALPAGERPAPEPHPPRRPAF